MEECNYAFSFSFELLINSVIPLALRNPTWNYLRKLLLLLYFCSFFMERFSRFLSMQLKTIQAFSGYCSVTPLCTEGHGKGSCLCIWTTHVWEEFCTWQRICSCHVGSCLVLFLYFLFFLKFEKRLDILQRVEVMKWIWFCYISKNNNNPPRTII